jgi:hypothetical protein
MNDEDKVPFFEAGSSQIICQASDAEIGEAVSRKSALQSDDGADAHKGPHGNVLRGFAARYPGNPLAEKLKLAATWVDNLNAKLRQLEEAQADTPPAHAVGCWFNHEKDLVPISVDLGEHGLYYGTSKAEKGLLVIGNTVQEVIDRVPQALAELQQARRQIEEPQGDDPTAEQTPLA